MEREQLSVPNVGEVRIKMLATSASFTDALIRRNRYPIFLKPPFVPGYEVVGEIDALGEGVTQFSIGDRVAALTVVGGNREILCLKADKLIKVPPELDAAEAIGMVLSYCTAYQMLHRIAKVKQGDTTLVHGAAGAVGNALVQLGVLAGLKMFGTASASKHNIMREAGVVPIDYQKEDFVEVVKEHYPEGIDAVFDPFGGDIAQRSFSLLKRNGILVGFGFLNQARGKMALVGLEILRLKYWNLLPNGKRTAFYSLSSLQQQHFEWFREDLERLFALL